MGIKAQFNFKYDLGLNILTDSEFNRFRQVLDAEMKRLSEKGVGCTTEPAAPTTEPAAPITVEDEGKLWKKGLLGDRNLRVLLNTIVFRNGKKLL